MGKLDGAVLPVNTGIAGVDLVPLKVIPTPGGPVLHMLRNDAPFFDGFGEIYFSEVEPGAVKAWKCHLRQNQIFCVPAGLIKIVIYDDRPGSISKGEVREVILGRPDNYNLLRVPSGLWYGFSAIGPGAALLCNCANLPHDPSESIRKESDSADIPFRWS